MGAPKIEKPPPPPAPPPPPTETAGRTEPARKKTQAQSRRKGVSSLTIRRPSANTGASGMGTNVPY